MIEGLKEFQTKNPELVLAWNDNETEAKGWLVINSLRGGAAGGGTRMRVGVDVDEVRFLAKTMEIKFAVSGPAIGGAKSGIDFDPTDPRKEDVLRRWYKAILPMLKNCYGTGGDLNVDFGRQVIPLTKEVGLLHPQEGVLQGHFHGNCIEEKAFRLSEGTRKVVQDDRYRPDQHRTYTIADLVSGYSVAESVLHYYRLLGKNPVGKRVIVQGWGVVGSAAGFFLAKAGVNVVGIIDIRGGVINKEGFEISDLLSFMHEKEWSEIPRCAYVPFNEMNELFWHIPADVFIPAAASGLITQSQVQSMINAGVELIASGANIPFADDVNFFGPIFEYADNNISIIPDFIANIGIARVFAYLMQDDVDVSEEAIFNDVSETVRRTLSEVLCGNPGRTTQIAKKSIQNAIKQLI